MAKTENKLKPLAVFRAYQELIMEYHEKYGEIASRVDKNYLYAQVAKKFFISPKYAGQLVRYVMVNMAEFKGYEIDVDEIMAIQKFSKECKSPMKK